MSLDTAKAVAVTRSLTGRFDQGVAAATPFYPQLCTVIPSDGADEEYGMLGSVPGVREWSGDRLFHELRAARFVIENKQYESSVNIPKTRIADDRFGIFGPVLEQMGSEASYHPDELLFDVINAAESTECFDGQFFFDTDHSWGDSGTQSNDLSYNAADTAALTEAEVRAAYHAAREAMINFKRDNGKFFVRPIVEQMSDLVIVVPPTYQVIFEQALKKALVSSGETNLILDAPRIITSPHFTGTTKFDLYWLGGILKPFVFQAREPLERGTSGADDLETKDIKFMTQARYNVGPLAWWSAVRTTFT